MRSAPHCAPRCYLYLTVCISYVVRYQLRNSLIPPFLGRPCNPIMKVPLKWAEATAEMPLSCNCEKPERVCGQKYRQQNSRGKLRRSAANLVAMPERPTTAITIAKLV